ncbi:MAG: HAD family hydrolase [Proteobacteria bacterium]|nr:HAD family hydrolase [Pseudomonadota bacterium]
MRRPISSPARHPHRSRHSRSRARPRACARTSRPSPPIRRRTAATDVDIAAITLDLDDTLWPIEPVIVRAEERLDAWLKVNCPRAAAAYPIAALRELRDRIAAEQPHLAHDYSAQRRLSLQHALSPHGYGDAHIDAAYAEFYAARNEVDCYADTLPALERLAARFPLVSLSNGNADLRRIGLERFFRCSVSARECGVAKPDPAIFRVACDALGLPANVVLHVGDDALLDVAGAHAAGMRSAWVNRHGAAWTGGAPAHLSVVNLNELADRLLPHCEADSRHRALA